ncbi:MAG: hypothetical protein HRT66_10690 [Flavobacteriaceae bacterium]|nr:hypothetical protein [Flavobacteriaceae bacterium]
MIWFNITKLERRIYDNNFTDKDGFIYFMASMILSTLGTYIYVEEPIGLTDLVSLSLELVIMIWGVVSVFKINESFDKKDFFKRFFALSWVIGIRMISIIITCCIIILIIYLGFIENSSEFIESDDDLLIERVGLFVAPLLMIIYYFLLANSFRRISKQS